MPRPADDVFAETMSLEMLEASNARARQLSEEFDAVQSSQAVRDHAQKSIGLGDSGIAPSPSEKGGAF